MGRREVKAPGGVEHAGEVVQKGTISKGKSASDHHYSEAMLVVWGSFIMKCEHLEPIGSMFGIFTY